MLAGHEGRGESEREIETERVSYRNVVKQYLLEARSRDIGTIRVGPLGWG